MADLTANLGRAFQGEIRKRMFDVGANLEVFAGQAMISGSNGIVNATPGAGADFVGFALCHVNNLTNSIPYGGAARAAKVECAIQGFVELPVANGAPFTHDDKGLTVYATDGNTFTTSAGTNNVQIGTIEELDEAVVNGGNTETVLVKFGF